MPAQSGVARRWLRRGVGNRLDNYRAPLSIPGALRFVLAATPGRVGIAMTGLGIVLLVHAGRGSFGAAGLVTAGFAVAEAGIGPQVARLIDRHGQPRVLPGVLAAHGVAVCSLVTAVHLHAPDAVLVGAGVLVGATIPQLGALTSARWAWLCPDQKVLSSAYSLESQCNAIAYLVGPAVVGIVSVGVAPAAGSLLAAALIIASGFSLALQRRTAPPPSPPVKHERGSPGLVHGGFITLVLVSGAIGVFFGSMTVTVTAFAAEHGSPGAAGPLASISSGAGLIAGLAFGAVSWQAPARRQLTVTLGALTVGCVPLLFMDSIAGLAPLLVLPGLALTPTLVVANVLTERLVPRGQLTQAFTWLNSASAAGSAIGASLTGQAVDALTTRWGFGLALSAVGVAATAALVGQRYLEPTARPTARPAAERRPDRFPAGDPVGEGFATADSGSTSASDPTP